MSLFSAAILAQVLTAGVGDRVEARAIVQPADERMEAENAAYASVGLNFDWLTLRLTYSPSLLLSPVERTPRVFALTHTITGVADSNVTLYESVRFVSALHLGASYTQQDFRRRLLGAPVSSTPAPTPTSTAAGEPTTQPTTPVAELSPSEAVRINGLVLRTGSAVTDATFLERLSRRNSLLEYAGYAVSSGFDRNSRVLFPLAHGPRAGMAYIYGLSPRDTLTTRTDGQLTFVPSTGERAWIVSASEGITHLFSRRVTGDAALGIAYTRTDQPDVLPSTGVYPTMEAGLTYNTLLARGRLLLRVQLSYSPVLDRSSVLYDPRVSVLGNASWTGGRWTLYAATTSAVSTSSDDPGALSAASGNAGAAYRIGAGFAAEGGVRVAWQNYQGNETLPPTWVGFVALSYGYDFF